MSRERRFYSDLCRTFLAYCREARKVAPDDVDLLKVHQSRLAKARSNRNRATA